LTKNEHYICPAGTTLGASNNFRFTGKDFFIDKDLCSVVLGFGSGRWMAKKDAGFKQTASPALRNRPFYLAT
jgi:hypothetical protein